MAPVGRDAIIAAGILNEANLDAHPCGTLADLVGELETGAAFVIITEEAITGADLSMLSSWLDVQEEWSDLPFVLLTRRGGGLERNPAAKRYLQILGNVTFLERPFHPTTLISLGQAALRARRRQYEARTRLKELRASEERLRFLDQLAELVQPLKDSKEIMAATARHLGEYLKVAVCAYADMEEDGDGFTIRGNWAAPSAAEIVGYYKLRDFGETAFKELRAGRPLVTRDTLAELGPVQSSLFLKLGLKATVCMPLIKNDRLSALMAVHHSTPRNWSTEELGLIAETTERSWAHVERVGAEASLRASEARFKAAVGAVQGLLWTNDAEGKMRGVQPGWEALTGQTYSEYQEYGWTNALHPDDAIPTLDAWNQAVARRATFNFEHQVRRWDGEWRSYSVCAVPVLDSDGEIGEWVGVHTDITNTRLAEAALLEESATLEELNRTGALIAAELDLERLVQAVTDAGVSLVGAGFGAFFYNVLDERGESYTLYTLSGAKRSDFEGFSMPRATAVFRPTFMGDSVVRSDDILSDPRYGKTEPHFGMPKGHLAVRSYLAVPVKSRSGRVIGGLFFGHPEPARFTSRHEHLIVGIASQAAVAIDNAQLYQTVQRSNETLEQRVKREISERTKAEEALQQAQKMEAIGQLTGGVAHDFNNLLTIIKSSTDLLRRPNLAEDRRKRYVDAISETVDRASKLTGQLLAFARRQALKPEVFDVGKSIQSITEMLSTIVGSRIRIVSETPPEPCFITADTSQFETALVNLAVNARDAMEGEGTIILKVQKEFSKRLQSNRNQPALNSICISISDTGSGIPADKIDQIFQPFFTTKAVGKGTGLGLSQVFGFVKQSGGDVEVQSIQGQGATFRLYLPSIESPPDEQESSAQPHTWINDAVIRGKRILVVEDNAEVGRSSIQILQDLGYEPTLATNGEEALQILRSGNIFDVVFSDVVMPIMNGLDLANAIRRLYPNIAVLLTSGYSDVMAEEGRHGFELLHKPYAAEDLSRLLRKAVGRRV